MDGKLRGVGARQNIIRSWNSLHHFDAAAPGGIANAIAGKFVWTANGGMDTSAAQARFGARSLIGDGAADFLSAPAFAASFATPGSFFGTADWTIDFWLRKLATDPEPVFTIWHDANNYFTIGGDAADAIVVYGIQGGVDIANYTLAGATSGFVTNTWMRYMICRSGAALRIAVGQAAVNMQPYAWTASPTLLTAATTLTMNAAEVYHIGRANAVYCTAASFIDELRIVNGQALKLENMVNLTPWAAPAAAFSVDQAGSPNDNYNQTS